MAQTLEQSGNELNPDELMQMGMSFMSSCVLAAAVQLDVCSLLAAGHHTAFATLC
jgi:hypothetical protein